MKRTQDNTIEQFFADYERGANTFDPDLITGEFTDCFMAADPNGVVCIQNDDAFQAAISQRRELFRQIGFQSAKILSLDATPLDDYYTLVKVHWRMVFEKEAGHPLKFQFYITYFLRKEGDSQKVVFYISHESEQKVMQESGLLPVEVNK